MVFRCLFDDRAVVTADSGVEVRTPRSGVHRVHWGFGDLQLRYQCACIGIVGRAVHATVFSIFALCVSAPSICWAAGGQKFQADEWITECDVHPSIGAPDCSITVPFWQTGGDSKGSFALVVMLQTGSIGIVGQPFPKRAVLRVDKNPPIECKQSRYCIFPGAGALAVLRQLSIGSLILIDVYTAKGEYNFSLTPKGFQAGVAQIRAWGYWPNRPNYSAPGNPLLR
jgi:hypothetical protein